MTTREEMRSLADDIARSYEERISGIAELREIVKADMKEFQDSRAAMSKELKTDLVKSVADRKHEVGAELKELSGVRSAMSKELKTDLAESVADRKHEVGAELKELSSVRSAMSKELKTDLAKSVADRKHEVGVILKGFNAELKEVRSELTGGRDEWQKMTATMQSRRGGVAVAVKIPEGAAEITSETTALREQVFEYLANHPDGTRLVELAAEFGVARIQIGKVIRNLMDENKVEKRALLYFAV